MCVETCSGRCLLFDAAAREQHGTPPGADRPRGGSPRYADRQPRPLSDSELFRRNEPVLETTCISLMKGAGHWTAADGRRASPASLAVPCRPGPFGSAEAQPSKISGQLVVPALVGSVCATIPRRILIFLSSNTCDSIQSFRIDNGGRLHPTA